MTPDPIPMHHARHLESQNKQALVLAALDAATEAGGQRSIAGIARTAGVGRKFIYDHPDLRAQIELRAIQATQHQANGIVSAARVTGASLRVDLENARAQNLRLNKRVRALENRLSQTEGAHLVTDKRLPQGLLAELADRQLDERVSELEQQLFESIERLRHAEEELEAARAINRELMQRANRPDHNDRRAPKNAKAAST